MIPVPMLALAASPTDKQISKIVTLDYPTGQNSVAIITGLGELFLQGYNHYGECAVGETTAFYDHFAQITNINGSNNYQCLDVFVAGGAFVYNLDLPSGRHWMFTGSQAELLGDQSTAIASTPTELPAAYSKVTHTEHGAGSLREVRGTFGHNLWLYQFEDGFWGLYINGSNSSEIMLAQVAEPKLLAVSQHKFPHFCVTDNSASYMTTDGVLHMLGSVQSINGVDTSTGPDVWVGYEVSSLTSITSGVKFLDYRLDANICTFIVGDDSNVLSHELAEGAVWFRMGSRNYYERGANPPTLARFFPGTGAHHVVDVNSGSIYGFANSNKSGYLDYNDSYSDNYVAYNGCLVAFQWGREIAWIINTSTYANGHKDKEAKSFITFFVIDGKLYYSGSRVSSDGTNSAPEIFGKRCYAARSILIPDVAYRNLPANSITIAAITGQHATGETLQLQVANDPVGSTVYSVSLNTNAASDQLQFTQDDPNLFYIKGLKAGTYNIQLTGKTGSPSVAISSNTVTVTFSTGISGSVSYIGPVGEIPGGDTYNTAEYFKTDVAYSLGVTASDVTTKTYFNSFINKDGEFEVKQDENYNIKKHNIILSGLKVSFIELDGIKYEPTNFEKHSYFDNIMIVIPVDFDNPAKELKLHFIDNFADALSIKLKFVAADKGLYDAKMLDALIKERTKTANIKVSTGADLVNIYFQPCCEDYVRTEIVLFKDNMMLAKYKIDEEAFFKSIGGLAYGKYTFVLKQFDKDSNALFETEHIEFTISSPKPQGIMPRVNRF